LVSPGQEGLPDVGGVRRVPDQAHGLITAPGQEVFQQQRDLPVPTRDYHAHAASLRTGITGRRHDTPRRAAIGRDLLAIECVTERRHGRRHDRMV
jgi:hypothetical protein